MDQNAVNEEKTSLREWLLNKPAKPATLTFVYYYNLLHKERTDHERC